MYRLRICMFLSLSLASPPPTLLSPPSPPFSENNVERGKGEKGKEEEEEEEEVRGRRSPSTLSGLMVEWNAGVGEEVSDTHLSISCKHITDDQVGARGGLWPSLSRDCHMLAHEKQSGNF